MEYGKKHHLSQLTEQQQNQVNIIQGDVLGSNLPKADIVCALNFSYFCFKERKTLSQYFNRVHKSLNDDGVLVLDCFGGSDCIQANEEEIVHEEGRF